MIQEADPCYVSPSSLPTELIPGFLFVGSFDHASRGEMLKTLGIGYILNVSCPACYLCAFCASSILSKKRID